MRSAFLILVVLLFCQAGFGQAQPPVTNVEELYLAKDDGSGKAGEQVTEFRTTDVPIFCVVLLDTNEKVTVKMNFVAVSVAGVRADTKVVTASYTTREGQNRVNFSGRPEGRWTPGRYRVDIFIDGKVVKNIEFDIKGPGGNSSSAANLFKPAEVPKLKPVRTGSK
ncbi:MAG: hypothetical protein ABIV21_04250 [Pyrinomonadaceae bacterium]